MKCFKIIIILPSLTFLFLVSLLGVCFPTHYHHHFASFPLLLPGKGCIYSFDVVGSYDREVYRAAGSAASMLQPLLDNQVSQCGLHSVMDVE